MFKLLPLQHLLTPHPQLCSYGAPNAPLSIAEEQVEVSALQQGPGCKQRLRQEEVAAPCSGQLHASQRQGQN